MSSRMDDYEEEFFDRDCSNHRAWGWHDWVGGSSGRRWADVRFAICGGARLQRQAGEECRGGTASGESEGQAVARRVGVEDGRGGADEHRRDSVWSAADTSAGAGLPDFWGRLPDRQGGDVDYSEAEASGGTVLDIRESRGREE